MFNVEDGSRAWDGWRLTKGGVGGPEHDAERARKDGEADAETGAGVTIRIKMGKVGRTYLTAAGVD